MKEELNIENINYKKVDAVKFPYNKYIFNVFYSEDNIDVDKLEFQEEVIQVNWFIKDEIINLLEKVVVLLL
ncbi:MAG: hypothetical protein RR406_03600 [Bacilli bacterium]